MTTPTNDVERFSIFIVYLQNPSVALEFATKTQYLSLWQMVGNTLIDECTKGFRYGSLHVLSSMLVWTTWLALSTDHWPSCMFEGLFKHRTKDQLFYLCTSLILPHISSNYNCITALLYVLDSCPDLLYALQGDLSHVLKALMIHIETASNITDKALHVLYHMTTLPEACLAFIQLNGVSSLLSILPVDNQHSKLSAYVLLNIAKSYPQGVLVHTDAICMLDGLRKHDAVYANLWTRLGLRNSPTAKPHIGNRFCSACHVAQYCDNVCAVHHTLHASLHEQTG